VKALKEGTDKRAPLFKATEKHFLLIWIFFIFIFFSVSSSKLVPYIAPIFLPIAIIFGHLFRVYEDRNVSLEKSRGRRLLYDLPIILQSLIFITVLILPSFIRYLKPGIGLGIDWDNIQSEYGWGLILLPILFQVMIVFFPALVKQIWRRGWFLTIYVLSALFLISIHFPIAQFLGSHRSAYPVSKAIDALLPPNQELFQFRTSLYGIDFYNKIRTPLVGRSGELEFGFNQLPPDERSHYHLSYDEFYQRCKENGDIYCVTRYKEYVDELKRRFSTVEILWDNGEFYLLRLRC
jgi:4-amino-4-deoxy-L-arabinose transferase-like glycosyltransferase